MSEPIILGGVHYRPVVKPTFRQEMWVAAIAQRAGLEKPLPLAEETPNDFAWRVVSKANDAGVLFDLLGGVLMREGVEDERWTVEDARTNGILIAALQDEEEKRRARQLIAEVLIPFMRAGLASFKPTPASSGDDVSSAGDATPPLSPSSEPGTARSG